MSRTALTLALAVSLALLPACTDDRRLAVRDERPSVVAAMSGGDVEGYARAVAPRTFVFPADHGPHPDFKLEWWYFTGNLTSADGRRFGYQLTFFRQALTPTPAERPSAWATSSLYFAHFAVADIDGGSGERFHAFERFARGAAGLAGASAEPFRVWLDDWSVASTTDAFFPLELAARASDEGDEAEEVAIELALETAKPFVLQGEEGLSRKGAEPGQATYYYSATRMPARGKVRIGEASWPVTGSGWLDREWSTSVLGPEQEGWDWFALQLDDGSDLMFYQLRLRGGGVEPRSHGSLIDAAGGKRPLHLADVELAVTGTWTSPEGTVYPAGWRLEVPSADLELTVAPLLADQELDASLRYWEGAVGVHGRRDGREVGGRGYVELVGYGE